jgi:hypothetical protein
LPVSAFHESRYHALQHLPISGPAGVEEVSAANALRQQALKALGEHAAGRRYSRETRQALPVLGRYLLAIQQAMRERYPEFVSCGETWWPAGVSALEQDTCRLAPNRLIGSERQLTNTVKPEPDAQAAVEGDQVETPVLAREPNESVILRQCDGGIHVD